MFRLLPAFALVAFSSLGLQASEVRLSIQGIEEETLDGSIVLVPAGGIHSTSQGEIRLKSARPVDLPEGSLWKARFESDTWWAAERIFAVTSEATSVVLQAFPAGWISGTTRVVTPREELPQELTVRFRPVEEGANLPTGKVVCSVEGSAFRCTVPAGRMDWTFRAPGFLSQHRWGRELKPRQDLDVGNLPLRAGASVIGWIEPPRHRFDLQRCRVELAPNLGGLSDNPVDRRARSSVTLEGKLHPRGFFEIVDVPEGSHTLTVTHPDYAPAHFRPVAVYPRAETEVPPITLSPPVSLEVHIQPATDPFLQSWTVELSRDGHIPGRSASAAKAAANELGQWRGERLTPGEHHLRILDSRGSPWHWEIVQVEAEGTPVEVELPLLRLEAQLLYGDEPVEGTVFFGGRWQARHIQVASRDGGKVYAFLPAQDSWPIVDVESPGLGLRARFEDVAVPPRQSGERWPKIELRIPPTEVQGEVVTAKGEPIQGALITVRSGGVDTFLRSGPDGDFVARGLPEGEWRIEAEKQMDSGPAFDFTEVAVTEEGAPTVRLVLRPQLRLSGLVTSDEGRGIPGARVLATPERPPNVPLLDSTVSEATTDIEGVFELILPPGTEGVQLTVYSPGYTVTQLRVNAQANVPLMIPVTPIGGTVVVHYGSAQERVGSFWPRTALIGDFWFNNPFALLDWAQVQGIRPEGDRITLPNLPPGPYTACFDVHPIVIRGGVPNPRDPRCVSGTLAPYSQLVLEVPVPSAAE